MNPFHHLFSGTYGLWQHLRGWHVAGLMGVLAATGSVQADTLTLYSDTTWRAIGPAGNLEGNSINSVGLAWEAAHPGWNSSLSFNDSDAAGWHWAIISPLSTGSAGSLNSIWSDGNGYNGSSPAYFRKTFTLSGTPTSGLLDVHIDDDVQVYLNGALILDDHNFQSDNFLNLNVTPYLVQGPNLLAFKANDSWGIGEQLAVALTVQTVPEPATVALVAVGVAGLVLARRRK